ncbi:hypothetical protein SAMN04488508_10655 [Aquimarina spongiae]|uniref:Uncharacterized protein n=1 Tax=Aquimarina spongiae TaxID=570521 RepID=A0A1M6H3T4_9FLAO|nr:hypothetical protein SAMN04488508_10655 [Aquimarina spongiae]
MNLNLISYLIYLLITIIIIIKVGSICYTNGKTFVIHLIPNDKEFCLRINNILLTGYYLLNMGYAIITLSKWNEITTYIDLIETVSYQTAKIILTLAILHYFNVFWISKFIKNINNTKTI